MQQKTTVDCHPALGIGRLLNEFEKSIKFQARHPMFKYQTNAAPQPVIQALKAAKEIVVVGLGGSILPLRSLVDIHRRAESIFYLDTVDSLTVARVFQKLTNPIFCIVSKSGQTLEIQVLLEEIRKRFGDSKILAVTDPKAGKLRSLAYEKNWLSLSIPPEIGGRFTHFTDFHRAILESWGISINPLAERARKKIAELTLNPEPLDLLRRMLFDEKVAHQIFWHYGSAREGMALWMQQVLAESLGKTATDGLRRGVLPTVLAGPQAQHSVLQLLMDGPQNSTLWFLEPDAPASSSTLDQALWVLCEATKRSFLERLADAKTSQSVIASPLSSIEDAVDLIVILQALVEYSADVFKINAFDQPGVERGKTIARELWSSPTP